MPKGNTFSMGAFTQCISTEARHSLAEEAWPEFSGQHCYLRLRSGAENTTSRSQWAQDDDLFSSMLRGKVKTDKLLPSVGDDVDLAEVRKTHDHRISSSKSSIFIFRLSRLSM